MKTLVLGMGNPILTDDAVGIRLAKALAAALPPRPDVDLCPDCSAGGLEILAVLEGYDRVLVFDSVKTVGGEPGSWYRFDGRALGPTLHLTNLHDTNFATALELGHRLGLHLPAAASTHVLAVEVADNRTFSERLSPALEARWDSLSREVLAEAEALLTD